MPDPDAIDMPASISQTEICAVPDPVLTRLHLCPGCSSPMGGYTVYKGDKPGKQKLCGRIAQICTNRVGCHHTHFHTTVNYLDDDVEKLIQRIIAKEIDVVLPTETTNAPLRVYTPLVPQLQENGRIGCSGDCMYKTGGKPPALQTCIGVLCNKCCRKEAEKAGDNNIDRPECQTHKVAAVHGNAAPVDPPAPPALPPPPPPPPPPVTPTQTTPSAQIPTVVPTQPQSEALTTQALSQDPPTSIVSTITAPQETPLAASGSSTPPALSTSQAVTKAGKGNRRPKPLAQPIGPAWLASQTAAATEAKQADDLKMENHRINEELKKTIDIHLYYKTGKDCISYAAFVNSYPKMRLESIPLIMDKLSLTRESLFDVWTGHWETKTPSSIIDVNKARPLIIVLHSSLIEDIEVSAYPGLHQDVEVQCRSGLKRSADTDLVSPLKKTPRQGDQSSVQHVRNASFTSTSLHPSPTTQTVQTDSPLSALATPTPAIVPTPPSKPYIATAMKDFAYVTWIKNWEIIKEKLDHDPHMTEATAVPIVFGCVYNKSTVCLYKKHVKNASNALKGKFLSYGNSACASMTRFSLAYNDEKKAILSKGKDYTYPTPATPTIQPALPSSSSVPPLPLVPDAPAPVPIFEQSQEVAVPEEHAETPRLSQNPSIGAPFPVSSPLTGNFPTHIKPEPIDHKELNRLLKEPVQEPVVSGVDLCPFCDEKFPESPSSKLLELCEVLKFWTYSDPTPDNPLHRSADSFRVFIEFCTLHRFEAKHLPAALAECWPLDPDFGLVFDRVCRSFLFLNSIAESGVNEFLVEVKEHYRAGSGAMKDFASNRFLESGAGYYGEPGYWIIMSAVCYLFPRNSINTIHIHPLTHEIFLCEVLTHKAAVQLIQVDLNISREEAIAVFRKSCVFGNIQHPTDTQSSSDKYDIHIAAAVRRSSKATRHEDSVYHRWIASGSPLWIDEWLQLEPQPVEQLTEEEIRIKEEEMDLDPLANQGDLEGPAVVFATSVYP